MLNDKHNCQDKINTKNILSKIRELQSKLYHNTGAIEPPAWAIKVNDMTKPAGVCRYVG